jgi:hypothetical protein
MEDNIHLFLMMSDSEVKDSYAWVDQKERNSYVRVDQKALWSVLGQLPRGPKFKKWGTASHFLNFGPKRPYMNHVFVFKPTAPELSWLIAIFSPLQNTLHLVESPGLTKRAL